MAKRLLFVITALFGALASLVLVGFAAGDLVLSAIGRPRANLSLASWEYIEGRGVAAQRGQQGHSHYINSYAMRRDELPPLVPGEQRILMLGDSTCYSAHSVQGRDWPGVVERELRGRGVPATTMNAGYPGYRVRSMFLAYRWLKPQIPIDVVVIYGGWNDILTWDRTWDWEFDYDAAARRLFPDFPNSLEPHPELVPYDTPSPPPENVILAPPLLGVLAHSSPLMNRLLLSGRALNFMRWMQDRPGAGAGPAPKMTPSNRSEWYMLYLGLLIREVQRDGVTPVMVRPFSVFRIPDYDSAEAFTGPNMLYTFSVKDIPMMRSEIERMDRIQDLFAAHTSALLIDPTPGMLRHINQENIFRDLWLGSPIHTKPKGDALLGSLIAEALVEKTSLRPLSPQPWKHPHEAKRELDYGHRPVNLAELAPRPTRTGNVIPAVLGMMAVFSVVGVLLCAGLLGTDRVEPLRGWSLALGVVPSLALSMLLYQVMDAPGLLLTLALSFLVVASLLALRQRGEWTARTARTLAGHAAAGTAAATLLAMAELELMLHLSSGVNLTNLIRDYASWIDLQADQGLLGSAKVHYYHIYQAASASGQFGTGIALQMFERLLTYPTLHAAATPFLAGAVHGCTGLDPVKSFTLTAALPGALLALPLLAVTFQRSTALPLRFLATLLAAGALIAAAGLPAPITGTAAMALAGFSFAGLASDRPFTRWLVAVLAAGMAMLLPSSWTFLLLAGIVLGWPLVAGGPCPRVRAVAGTAIGAVLAILVARLLYIRYTPVASELFDSLASLGIIEASGGAAPLFHWIVFGMAASAIVASAALGGPRHARFGLAVSIPFVVAMACVPEVLTGLVTLAILAVAGTMLTRLPANAAAKGSTGAPVDTATNVTIMGRS
ncbi:MAG: SGNH/GDSL hydrolase family protein [Planctomycetes bacterium]|nr:SGNH/GDSL hydrolase family protein [Planctomycetota bacterium]